MKNYLDHIVTVEDGIQINATIGAAAEYCDLTGRFDFDLLATAWRKATESLSIVERIAIQKRKSEKLFVPFRVHHRGELWNLTLLNLRGRYGKAVKLKNARGEFVYIRRGSPDWVDMKPAWGWVAVKGEDVAPMPCLYGIEPDTARGQLDRMVGPEGYSDLIEYGRKCLAYADELACKSGPRYSTGEKVSEQKTYPYTPYVVSDGNVKIRASIGEAAHLLNPDTGAWDPKKIDAADFSCFDKLRVMYQNKIWTAHRSRAVYDLPRGEVMMVLSRPGRGASVKLISGAHPGLQKMTPLWSWTVENGEVTAALQSLRGISPTDLASKKAGDDVGQRMLLDYGRIALAAHSVKRANDLPARLERLEKSHTQAAIALRETRAAYDRELRKLELKHQQATEKIEAHHASKIKVLEAALADNAFDQRNIRNEMESLEERLRP